jgi:hypothetical protein
MSLEWSSCKNPSCVWCSGKNEYTPQPPPKPNNSAHIADLVNHDIALRKVQGIAKYGTALQGGNGRDALRDLYEELLDAAQYCRQVLYERDGK